jgi:hypothetical protein
MIDRYLILKSQESSLDILVQLQITLLFQSHVTSRETKLHRSPHPNVLAVESTNNALAAVHTITIRSVNGA